MLLFEAARKSRPSVWNEGELYFCAFDGKIYRLAPFVSSGLASLPLFRSVYLATTHACSCPGRGSAQPGQLWYVQTVNAQAARKVAWDYEAYCGFPDDGKRYEIIEGELHVSPAPSTLHQLISQRIETELVLQIQRQGLGYVFHAPVDVMLSSNSFVQPDIVVLKRESRSKITRRAIEGAPELIIEILSPFNRRTDVLTKAALYAQFGVTEYWLIDPDIDEAKVYLLRDSGYALDQEHHRAGTLISRTFEVQLDIVNLFAPLE